MKLESAFADNSLLIEEMRSQEVAESVGTIVGDEDAMRILSVWKFVRVEKVSESVRRKNLTGSWQTATEKMWSGCHYEIDQVSMLSGVTVSRCAKKLYILQSLGLIYPDNTISKFASALIRNVVRNAIGKPARKQAT